MSTLAGLHLRQKIDSGRERESDFLDGRRSRFFKFLAMMVKGTSVGGAAATTSAAKVQVSQRIPSGRY